MNTSHEISIHHSSFIIQLRITAGKILNVSLIILILLIVFVPDTKTWFMRQLIRTGAYNAKPGKATVAMAPTLAQLGLVLRNHKGDVVRADSLVGKVVFINFWATWCPPCRAEMPSLNNLYETFKDAHDIMFIFISEDEQAQAAADYLAANRFSLPLYTATGQATGAIYGGTLPTTLLFDKQGALQYKHEGMANYNTGEFKSRIKALQ